ncbi:hypothetical protein ENSA5_41330 [Enhygromyxa salina]|uniref:Ion transport domain-containing protein n=1 Tax=Enhygromyxa salina TaxID=215803 RepID=A0A2S9XMS7_9BACT|nr:hypothetical protein ENSA5_41330 [Enhygromyxa salina]
MFAWVARFLGRVESRLVLSAAIIVSLLPFEWVPRFDALFLALFSIEFGLRVLLVFRGEALHAHGSARGVTPTEAELEENRGWQWPSTGTLVLMLFDLLALLSFVPSLVGLDDGDAQTRWLRLFRLTRMMLLLSYWAPLVRDVWSVVLRHERAKQVTLMGLVVLSLSFAGAVVIDQLRVDDEELIDFDGDGEFGLDEHGQAVDPDDERFVVHLWWAFRQIQDPGNMMSSPEQIAAVVVSVALTVFGLFLVSFLIGLGTDVVRELMELSRLRPPGLHGHTIIVNIDPSTQRLLHELLRYSRKLLPEGALSRAWLAELIRNTKRGIKGARYLVVGRSHDPPDFLRQPELARIIYREVHVEDQTFLVRTDVAEAQRVVLLADLAAEDPDAATIQSLLTITESLREADEEARRRDSLWGLPSRSRRARMLIAEVLDESNVPAARAAIAGDGSGRDSARTRAFVVPSERLIALFVACITRRPGVGRLLEELLTSHGHELYTMFFDLPGLAYRRPLERGLGDDAGEVMGELIRRARSLASTERVVPVGVLMAGEGGADDIVVHINPEPDFSSVSLARGLVADVADLEDLEDVEDVEDVEGAAKLRRAAGSGQCLGFVAIADNFARVRELADDLHDRARAQVPADLTGSPKLGPFVCADTTKLHRVLVCGFRSGTVSMVESLIQSEPQTQILIMLRDQAAVDAAWDNFDAHTKLIERGLLRGHHGRFRVDENQRALTWLNPDDPSAPSDRPHVHLVIGDWSSSRQLTALPLGFGHVGTMDAVLLISSEHVGSDARTSKTLMKLETLTQAPRIVAEVLDVELARRLRKRGVEQGSDRVHVYSIQELRAFFMFQSVVVPAFDLVYTELMGPWGQSFVQLEPDPSAARLTGTCTFEELANHLSLDDRVLCGVELCHDSSPHQHSSRCRTSLHVADAGSGSDSIDLEQLVDVWVISSD